ncbi:MAG: hypothetical protein AAGK09_12070 [Planctomycetota bacterium]
MVATQSLTPPVGSTLEVDVTPDALTLRVPRQPIRKASKGLLWFAIFWLGFIGLFTGVLLLNLLFGIGESDFDWSSPRDVAFLTGILALFWAVGIGMLVAAINASRRESIFDVVDGQLIVTRRSLFGTRQHLLNTPDITLIHRGPTGTEINSVPVQALQIESRHAKRLQLLSHLTNEEIDFAVSLLRRAAGVAGPAAADEDDEPFGRLGDEA